MDDLAMTTGTLIVLVAFCIVVLAAVAIPIEWVRAQLDRRDTIRRSQGR